MVKWSMRAKLFLLPIALAMAAEGSRADTGWTMRCEDLFSCSIESTQCGLSVIIYSGPTTEGHWVGILGVPRGWSKVVIRASKGNALETRTINAPQLPGMAFGDRAFRDLILSVQSAELQVFVGDSVAKYCRFSLEGLAQAHEKMRQRPR